MSFVHLHTHTEYSLLDGMTRVKELAAQAKKLDMPAMAITDHGYMHGAIAFYKAMTAEGVKPILGCEVYFTPGSRLDKTQKPELYHLLLLAKNQEGYRNLLTLVSRAAVEGFYYRPRIDRELLEEYSAGLIATSACMSGIVSKNIELGNLSEAKRWAEYYARTFEPGNFFLEIQNQGITSDLGVKQAELASAIVGLGKETGIGVVATNDIHYLRQEDAEVQDVLMCIGTGQQVDNPNRMKFSCDEFYCKSPEQMKEVFPEYPEAISNTVAIADMVDVELDFGKIILPVFDVPKEQTEHEYLTELVNEGLIRRYGETLSDEVKERRDYELSIIEEKGISAYFLIVADFTHWAKEQGIGVGPGRGSAAGSIVAYGLSITDIDPLEFGLLFERFLNPERTEMPDIDMDFDDRRRLEVIDYVREKYGSNRVAQIVTFSTLQAKGAVRDVGRVLGYDYQTPDKITKQIGNELGVTISKALEQNPDLKKEYRENEDTKRILNTALQIEGITRNEGVHAAAVVIARDDLSNYVPVKFDTKGGAVVTQFDGSTVADMGLLKMDFLGLRNLSVIKDAIENIKRNHGIEIDESKIPFDDKKTYELLSRGDTAGVFQVESPGMRALLKRLKPSQFSDIIAVIALFRPGPLGSGMVDDFVKRKAGDIEITYYDERLKPILEETYGTIVYQEQVMRVSMMMSGFSAAKADKLRKAMAKKQRELLDTFEVDWVEGARENGYDPKMAAKLWKDILPFSEYAFNKSHSAAYSVITFRTAYLKAHYPAEVMAAVLSSYTGSTERIVEYVNRTKEGGIEVLPPDVNTSFASFTPVSGEGIRFGLAGIRGVGEAAVAAIVAAREEGGRFTSLRDFVNRVDLRATNRKTIEALIKAGAFDSTGYPRRQLLRLLDEKNFLENATAKKKDVAAGQLSFFDLADVEIEGLAEVEDVPETEDWEKRIKLGFEKEMLGLYVSDHPLNAIKEHLAAAADVNLSELGGKSSGYIGKFTGMLTQVRSMATRSGKMMAVAMLEDLYGSIEVVFFPKTFEQYRDIIADEAVVLLLAKLDRDDRGTKLLVQKPMLLHGVELANAPKIIEIHIPIEVMKDAKILKAFKETASHYPGKDTVRFHLKDEVTGKETLASMQEKVDSNASGLFADIAIFFGAGVTNIVPDQGRKK